jgi:hypothetical protein
MKIHKNLRGVLLATVALSMVLPSATMAQTVPGGSVNATASQQPAQQSTAQRIDPTTAAIVTRDDLTGQLRAPHNGEHSFGIISPEEFARAYPDAPPGTFESIREQDKEECAEVGSDVRELISILGETQEMMPELEQLRIDVAKLGGAQNKASLGQVGTTVVSTGLLCALSAGLYCAAAAVGGVGGLLGIGSHHKTEKLDRRTRDIDVRTRILDNRTRVLDLRQRFSWEKRMHPACIAIFPRETTGTVMVSGTRPW